MTFRNLDVLFDSFMECYLSVYSIYVVRVDNLGEQWKNRTHKPCPLVDSILLEQTARGPMSCRELHARFVERV